MDQQFYFISKRISKLVKKSKKDNTCMIKIQNFGFFLQNFTIGFSGTPGVMDQKLILLKKNISKIGNAYMIKIQTWPPLRCGGPHSALILFIF